MWGVGHNNPDIFQFFDETKHIDTSHGTHYEGKTLFNNYDWVRKQFNIAGRLKEYYNVPVIDESIYGGSLQRVVRKTYNWILNNDDKVKDTLFILEWPIGIRNEIYIPLQKRYVNYTANFDNFDNIDPYLHRLMINEIAPNFFSEGIAFIEDLHSLIGLVSYLKSMGGKCLILLDEFPFENFEKIYNECDKLQVLDWMDEYEKNIVKIFDYGLSHSCTVKIMIFLLLKNRLDFVHH
jgi:hypothetical protein